MAYSYYSPVTIDNTKVSGTGSHTDYIFLYKTTDARLKTVANGGHVENSSGFDIAFYNNTSATTKYAHKVLAYGASSGELIAWVKIPSVSTSVDTTFYIHYGDGTISSSQEDVTALFSGYSAVFDGDDTSTTTLADSTSNSNDLGLGTGSFAQQAGQIYKSRYFNNSIYLKRDDANCTNLEMGTSGVTISAWVKKISGTSNYESIITKGILAGGVNGGYGLQFYQGKAGFQTRNDTNSYFSVIETSGTYADSTWHYFVGTADRSTGITDGMKFYFDGSLVGTLDISSENGVNWDNGERLEIGARSAAGTGEYLFLRDTYVESGKIQIGTQKSADLIATEYNNQNSPSTFYTLGTEQTGGTPAPSTFIPRVTMF